MMRCRPRTVTHTAFATVPDQRCTASLSLALHRIRDTLPKFKAAMTNRDKRGPTNDCLQMLAWEG
jgi:hypothetical protein